MSDKIITGQQIHFIVQSLMAMHGPIKSAVDIINLLERGCPDTAPAFQAALEDYKSQLTIDDLTRLLDNKRKPKPGCEKNVTS